MTGAPLGQIDYEKVTYWDKITEVFDWAQSNVTSTMYSCWAAHAALYHFYGINRDLRQEKLSGVYHHQTRDSMEPLTRGFDEDFNVPHSRYGEVQRSVYDQQPQLNILADSEQAGVYLVATKDKKHVFVTGHPEYDSYTLKDEYSRDIDAGVESDIPVNYLHDNDIKNIPKNSWRSHGCLLFSNWLNYYVYQETPYQLEQD